MEKRHHRPSDYLIIILTLCFFAFGVTTCDIAGIADIGDGSGSQPSNNQNQNPYADNSNAEWYKGNLHAHSYWSNGHHFPEMVFDWYKSHGYHFAVISEQNILPEGEKWIRVEDGSHTEAMFKEYKNRYGESWVEYEDKGSYLNVRLKTLEEFTNKLEESGRFKIFNSEEIDYEEGNLLVHMNVTNIQEVIQPATEGTVSGIMQQHIDKVEQQSSRLNTPMIVQINHPNINWSITADDIKKLEGARFFEVYNGHPNARNSGDANHQSTEEIWDEVNTDFAIDGKPLMYGLAVDDSHWYDIEYNNPGRGWVQVRSASLSRVDIITALKNGNFYSSTGVRLSDISFADSTLTVTIDAENGVNYTTRFIGTRSGQTQNPGIVLAEKTGTSASYTLSGNELYVRAKIISDKTKANPSEEGEVEVAWVQPIKNNNVSTNPPPSSSTEIVYDETLASPWINASWSSTVNYGSTEQSNSGSNSIKVQQNTWGALSVHSGNWGNGQDVDPGKYEGVSFVIYADNQSSKIDVMLENDQGESFPRVSYGTVAANQWTVVEIPMSELNPNNQVIHRVDILETSGSSKTYFVDDLKLTGSGGGGTPPPSPSAPTPESPANGASGVSTSLTLSWSGSNTSYHLKVAKDNSFQTITADETGLTPTSYTLSNLSNGTTYYWKVQGSDQNGNKSAWSATWSFTTRESTGSTTYEDIYIDDLQSPWIDASWSSTIDFNNTGQTYNGSGKSVKVEQDAWGALSVHSGNWGDEQDVDPAQYETVEFYIYAQNQQAKLSVMFENDLGESFPKVYYGSVSANQWINVSILMSELNPDNQIVHRLDIMETSGSAKTYFVDNIRLIQN